MREARYIRRLCENSAAGRTPVNPQDLQRLVEIITEELLAAQGPRRFAARCSCHAVQSDCCPTRLRGVLDAGASRLGLHATGGAPGGVVGDDRPHAAQGRRDARRDREALPRGGGVPVRHGLRQSGVGRDCRRAAARHRRRRLFGRRVPARRDDCRREELRDPPRDLRRRRRDRHGDQRRRAQVRRPAHRRARHRGGRRALPAVRRRRAR